MNIIFVSPIDEFIFAGYEDAKRLAAARSGCAVLCLEKHHSGDNDRKFCNLFDTRTKTVRKAKSRLQLCATRRFLIALDFIERHQIKPPFVFPDWDFLIFQNLTQAFDPFSECDFAAPIYNNGSMMSAVFANSVEPLRSFCNLALQLAKDMSDGDFMGLEDMSLWQKVRDTGVWAVDNTLNIYNDSVFDSGMHATSATDLPDGYKTDEDGYKALSWQDKTPYFETVDGRKIKANWIHCWGKYKSKTGELLKLAGI